MGALEAVILNQVDVKMSALQHTLLQAIAATVTNLTLEQKAAMDEATYSNTMKSGNNYLIVDTITDVVVGDASLNGGNTSGNIWFGKVTATLTGDVTVISFNIQTAAGNFRMALYSDNAGAPGTKLNESADTAVGGTGWQPLAIPATRVVSGTVYWIALQFSTNDLKPYYKAPDGTGRIIVQAYGTFPTSGAGSSADASMNMKMSGAASVTGTIKTASIAKDSNIGIRYWGDICANLVAGAAGSTIKAKICDSAGTALHSNFVTIAAAEYARIPLERPVVLTAGSSSQTVWNFTTLSNADAFINELGVLAKAILVELALDGTNYTVLNEVTDFTEDISDILAPKITLVSGTGVVNGTSKLRATYIVNIPLSNTTIKLQYQLNRVAGADTSPSIQPLVGDAAKYVSAGQVAII